MTEQENINIQSRVSSLETKFEMFMRLQDERFNNFMQEMRDFKTEMRDRDNQRAAENQELRKRQDAAQAKHDADMKEMNQRFYSKFDAMDKKIDDKFDKFSSQLQMMSITTILGVGAIVWAIVSALK